MVSVLFFCPWWQVWFLGGHLDYLCCDPGGGAFLDWSGLPPRHLGPQCPILSHLEQWVSCAGQFALPARCCWVQLGQSLEGADGVWPWLLWLVWAVCPLSWQIVSTGLVLWETCSLACWMAKWFTAISASLLEGVFNGLAMSFPRSFPSWWYARMVQWHSSCSWCSSLIISQWSIRVLMHAMRSWGSSSSLATISSNSPRCTWVLTLCVIPCWIWSRKAEALALVTFCSSLLPVGIHCACISRDLVPRAAKTYLRWSLLSGGMQLRRSQFSRVWQNMEKGVVCILGVLVVDRQAYWCCPNCQHTSNGICCGMGRLGDELL